MTFACLEQFWVAVTEEMLSPCCCYRPLLGDVTGHIHHTPSPRRKARKFRAGFKETNVLPEATFSSQFKKRNQFLSFGRLGIVPFCSLVTFHLEASSDW